MKILFIARNIPIPGVPENDIVLQLAYKLQESGDQIDIAFPAEWLPLPTFFLKGKRKAIALLSKVFLQNGFTVSVWRYARLPSMFGGYRFASYFWPFPKKNSENYTLIHAHHVMPDGAMALRLGNLWKIPVAVTVRQGDINKMEQPGYLNPFLRVLKSAQIVLTPSQQVAEQLKKWGIECDTLSHGISSAKGGVGLQASEKVQVAMVSSLLPRKNGKWLLQALAEYKGSTQWNGIHIGSGPEFESLQIFAQKHSLPFEFLRQMHRDLVLEKLSQSHIFALPSEKETFGLVYLEAAAQGCAVLARMGTGVHGYFRDQSEMLYCIDYEDFKRKLWSLLDNQDFRLEIAQNGHKRVQKDYLWDAIVQSYHNIVGASSTRG